MKPDWDKLMTEFDGHKTTLVGDVDCTAAGKPLCDKEGVKGFPTIKHGDVASLEDYQGGRDFDALQKFAAGLKPLCSPSNMDLCDADQKKQIEEVMALSDAEIDAKIEAADKKSSEAEKTFETELQKLQDNYKKLQEDKESALAEVKASGVGMVRAVKASRASGAGAKAEL
jgi:hypothetical protein